MPRIESDFANTICICGGPRKVAPFRSESRILLETQILVDTIAFEGLTGIPYNLLEIREVLHYVVSTRECIS